MRAGLAESVAQSVTEPVTITEPEPESVTATATATEPATITEPESVAVTLPEPVGGSQRGRSTHRRPNRGRQRDHGELPIGPVTARSQAGRLRRGRTLTATMRG